MAAGDGEDEASAPGSAQPGSGRGGGRLRVKLRAALPRPVQPPVPGLGLQHQPQRPARRQAADRDSGH